MITFLWDSGANDPLVHIAKFNSIGTVLGTWCGASYSRSGNMGMGRVRCDECIRLAEAQVNVGVIDVAHLARQAEWSGKTFGPGLRTDGVLDHIAKESNEVRADPTNLKEWVDIIILAFDGAWRTGAQPHEIIAAIKAKQSKNEARTWPDWRTADPDKAIEHDRSAS